MTSDYFPYLISCRDLKSSCKANMKKAHKKPFTDIFNTGTLENEVRLKMETARIARNERCLAMAMSQNIFSILEDEIRRCHNPLTMLPAAFGWSGRCKGERVREREVV